MGDLATQTDVIAFLSQPGSYPGDVKTVEILTTHASIVFLAGDRAYKLKKSVRYSYLDYSTQALRHDACAAELRLNRRTAPQLYLGVLSITRTARGTLSMCDDEDVGEAVDWVVVMRRFPQSCQFDRLAKRHRLSRDLFIQLTDSIVAFHAAAAPAPQFGGADGIAAVIQINDENLRGSSYFADRVTDINKLRDDSRRITTQHSPLLDRRRKAGRVRQCHGDLHLGNICLLDGHPVLFDCIEFSELISCIDVLYDLAFLLMDLRHRGHMQACTAVFNRYLDSSGNDDGLPLLSLFMSLRASVRAHALPPLLPNAHPIKLIR